MVHGTMTSSRFLRPVGERCGRAGHVAGSPWPHLGCVRAARGGPWLRVLDPGFWILGSGILGSGLWILDSGFWVPEVPKEPPVPNGTSRYLAVPLGGTAL